MNINLTEIAFVLDRSGSMSSCHSQAIAGFNKFIETQQETPGQARFTLVLFNSHYEVPVAATPLAEVSFLTEETFQPRGNTALLDAIGRTIDELGTRLATMAEAERPSTVIIAILTDGEENSSQHFTWKQIADKIAHQREVYQWQFFFLSADEDAIATAARMNIDHNAVAHYTADGDGTSASFKSMGKKMHALRKIRSNQPLTVEEQGDHDKTMSTLAAEDDAAERSKK